HARQLPHPMMRQTCWPYSLAKDEVRLTAGYRRPREKRLSGNPSAPRRSVVFVVPAKAGTQGFQSLAPGPPLSRGRRLEGATDLTTASKSGGPGPASGSNRLATAAALRPPGFPLSRLSGNPADGQFVVPAKAGTQGQATEIPGSRFRGND